MQTLPTTPMRALMVICLLLCAGCSQNNLLTKQDYRQSQQDFVRGDAREALLDFPHGREEGDFITTMEKAYLSLLQGKPQITALQKQAAWQENKVRYHVSREARTFFYVQTPEDYYPGEHEVIWMHLLLGWGYAQQGKFTDARVEARVAGSLLILPWSASGNFDDPILHLFLAGLWTMCGEWREAQVDLRAAWALDNSLAWARQLAERDRAPAHLFIVLGGAGPEVEWNPEVGANPLRSARQVSFRLRGRKSALSIADRQGKVVTSYLSPDAGRWYERHLARESELHQMIQDSAYGANATASGAKAAATIAAGTGKGTLVGIVGGAVAGVGVVAYAGRGAPTVVTKEAVVTAVAVGAIIGGVVGGVMGALEGLQESSRDLKRELDPSMHYRFVRYLPEYLWMGWSDQAIAYPVQLGTSVQTVAIERPGIVNGTSVTVAHVADSRQTSCSYRNERSSVTIVTAPGQSGVCPENLEW